MNRLESKRTNSTRRANRVRTSVRGTSKRPRLSINISNFSVSAQIIDDEKSVTIIGSTSIGVKDAGKSLTEKASWVGTDIGKKAKAKKIKQVAFDRGSKLYHGRVKALAEAARKEGLEF